MDERERQACEQAVRGFFAAIDAFDAAGTARWVSDDVVLAIETDGVRVDGRDGVRGAVERYADGHARLEHELLELLIDPGARRGAARVTYRGELLDGTRREQANCNFFAFDAKGRLDRVHVWMAAR